MRDDITHGPGPYAGWSLAMSYGSFSCQGCFSNTMWVAQVTVNQHNGMRKIYLNKTHQSTNHMLSSGYELHHTIIVYLCPILRMLCSFSQYLTPHVTRFSWHYSQILHYLTYCTIYKMAPALQKTFSNKCAVWFDENLWCRMDSFGNNDSIQSVTTYVFWSEDFFQLGARSIHLVDVRLRAVHSVARSITSAKVTLFWLTGIKFDQQSIFPSTKRPW